MADENVNENQDAGQETSNASKNDTGSNSTDNRNSNSDVASDGGLIDFEVGGRTLRLTPDEAREELAKQTAKANGLSKKVQNLQEGKNSRYVEMIKVHSEAKKGDRDAIARLNEFPELGYTEEEIKAALEGDDVETGDQKDGDADLREDRIKKVEAAAAELQREKTEREAQAIYRELDNSLDSDDHLSEYIVGKQNSGRRKRLQDHARGELARRAREAYNRGDVSWIPSKNDYREMVQEARSWLSEVMGSQEGTDSGLGRSGSFPNLGSSPSRTLSKLHKQAPPERPSSLDRERHSDYIAGRLAQEMTNGTGDDFNQ